MKKLLVSIIFISLLLTGYNQTQLKIKELAPTFSHPLEIRFVKDLSDTDLQVKHLTAFLEGDQVVFTLTFHSQKDRYLSFFSPPNGDALKYVDWEGLKRTDTTTNFRIPKSDFQSIDKISMRFGNRFGGRDRNFIFLNISDPAVKRLLGITQKPGFFYRILPFYSNLIGAIALWLLIPLILFIGTKTNAFTSGIERWIKNKWLLFNIKALFLSIAFVFIVLWLSGQLLNSFPVNVYLYLLLIPILPSNFVYLNENVFLKSRKIFWVRQYVNLIFIIIGLYIAYIVCNSLSGRIIARETVRVEYILLFGILTGLIRSINHYILREKVVSMQEKELEIARLNELKVRSDLNALQSKINPHFLYNALNSIAELCWKDPEKTERMALSLSKLFRYTINKEESDFNPLKTEIEIVSLYLTIEKERFGDHLNYEFDYSHEIETIPVPKFTLQPLIENAIKHGIAKKPTGGYIKLSIRKNETGLEIKVYDNGPDFPVNLMSGYGLQSIYNKLDILYPKRYSIELYNGEEKNITLLLSDGI